MIPTRELIERKLQYDVTDYISEETWEKVAVLMDERVKEVNIEFANWMAKCCYHKTDMDECDLENRGENDYSVLRYDDNDNAIETIYVKDSNALYHIFLAHTGAQAGN